MAKISTYPDVVPPALDDYVIGTDVSNSLATKSFVISDVIDLVASQFVTIVGAQTITGSKTFDYGSTAGVIAPVIINLQNQTQPAFSPDALLVQINGQTPSTIPGFIGGVVVLATLLDNVCYYADLAANSGTSRGMVFNSQVGNTGNFIELQKAGDIIFSVNPSGLIKAKNLPVYETNKDAVDGGLGLDFIYKTSSGALRIVV
jgi:hypothetical protein